MKILLRVAVNPVDSFRHRHRIGIKPTGKRAIRILSILQDLTNGEIFSQSQVVSVAWKKKNLKPIDGVCEQYTHEHSTYRVAQHDHANTRGSSASCIHLSTLFNSCHPRVMSRPLLSTSISSFSLSPSSPIFPPTSQTPTIHLVHHEHLIDDERPPCIGPLQSGGITPYAHSHRIHTRTESLRQSE